ncbi:MAG: hypothetical protein A2Y81_04030 [Nitrospirae bacterium RBG_13_43_8]|nr:MAG: hypothetical protein A2Y81_04030 [Nitrospirae bacterium RBG_13_43_8]
MFDKISPHPSLLKRGIQGNFPLWKRGIKGDFTNFILFFTFVPVSNHRHRPSEIKGIFITFVSQEQTKMNMILQKTLNSASSAE